MCVDRSFSAVAAQAKRTPLHSAAALFERSLELSRAARGVELVDGAGCAQLLLAGGAAPEAADSVCNQSLLWFQPLDQSACCLSAIKSMSRVCPAALQGGVRPVDVLMRGGAAQLARNADMYVELEVAADRARTAALLLAHGALRDSAARLLSGQMLSILAREGGTDMLVMPSQMHKQGRAAPEAYRSRRRR